MADHEHTAHESTSPKFWITWLRFRPICRRLASRINGLAVAGRRKLGLAGARYGLPAPVFHRQDRASFPGAQAIQPRAGNWGRPPGQAAAGGGRDEGLTL